MASMVKTPGAGLSQGKGGLSQGKGGGSVSPATLSTHAGGKPVVPQAPGGAPGGYKAGMQAPSGNPGGLAALFMGNQGYGGGSGGSLAEITQPTRESMGLPDITKMLSPRAPVQPTAPQPQAPNAQQIQQRIAQMTPGNEMTYGGGMGGSANPLIGGTMGAPAVFDEQYRRMKYQNPAMAQQMLERSPFKSLYAPVQGAAPPQPFQRSQASLMADEINRMAASRR